MNMISVSTNVLNGDKVQTVDARKLHEFLGVRRDFTTWLKQRISKYEFVENQDYIIFPETGEYSTVGRPSFVYHISLDMAKELSMVENNDKGRSARRYFIECERITRKSQDSLEWKQARLSGKQVRRSVTDTIKEFVEYATEQGSRNAHMYYMAVTRMEYKALGLLRESDGNFRDTMTITQLSFLSTAENLAKIAIQQGMDHELHYKQIYELAKNRVMAFAKSVEWAKLNDINADQRKLK